MNSTPDPSPTVVAPGQGRVIRAFGDEAVVHLDGEQTAGRLTLWTNTTSPGSGPPPHYHLNEDEWFVVQEGQVSFFADGTWRDVGPGGIVFAPRGSVHTFRNNGDKPVRMLVATSPSGFETFFARCEEEFNKPGGPNMDRIVAISAEHGIHFVKS